MFTNENTVCLILLLILLAYLATGLLYAIYTPAWQVPDEPAHYNYVRYLVDNGRFPVLQAGDYPHEYLETLKARHFPPDLSIDPVRYEFHQPPLYYLLAAPIYELTGGLLLPLRLFSVGLGALLLLVVYRISRDLFPNHPLLPLAATAFVATVPMHLAMLAGVNNDALAELLLALALWLSIRHVMGLDHGGWQAGLRLGFVLGLLLVTKTTAYVAVPVVFLALLARWWREWREVPRPALLPRLLVVLGPALLIALPWYVRNVLVYGWPDILGLRRHDAIVIGQPRTVDWIAQHGWHNLLERFMRFSFDSFWGVFGWLGVFMDERIYLVLALACIAVGIGTGVVLWRMAQRWPLSLTPEQRTALGLLVVSGLGTLAGYLGYNVSFVQHQGRYLFPALVPLSLLWAAGLMQALQSTVSRKLALLFLLLGGVWLLLGLKAGDVDKWCLVVALGYALAFGVSSLVPRRFELFLLALPYLALYALDIYALFAFVVPQLQE
ncbi:MAG TPA: hypothetical protein EYP04_00320 [Anaerolineae bacterium]|nr:hypothetical protein [Anaerolineae bacterium]